MRRAPQEREVREAVELGVAGLHGLAQGSDSIVRNAM
jgi:hypothetical protein